MCGKTMELTGKIDERRNVAKEPIPFEQLPEDVKKALKSKDKERKLNPLRELEQKYMLTTLIYLDEMSPVLKSDIYSNVSRSNVMRDKLDKLYEMDLITIYRIGRTDAQVVVITDKGREVAKTVRKIVEIIESD